MFYKKGIKMSENKKQDEKKLPNWLSFNADGEAVIKLLKEVEMNGVKQNQVIMREPTIGDVRLAKKQGKNDEDTEFYLFASLIGCSPNEVEKFKLKDYSRLQEGYFRLVREQNND